VRFIVEVADAGATGMFTAQAAFSGTSVAGLSIDISAPGTNPDPSGDGDPSGATEDDLTPVVIATAPSLGVALQVRNYRAR